MPPEWSTSRAWVVSIGLMIGAGAAFAADDRPGDAPKGIEPREIARVVADAKRHDALLERVARFEAEPASSVTDAAKLRRQLGAYRALIGYEQTTDLGARVLANASIRLARYESIAAPLDAGELVVAAELKVILYTVQRAYPLAAAWLPLAAGTAHGRVIAKLLAKLGQDRFDLVDRFDVGRYVVRSYRTRARPPDPALLWPRLHLVVTPAESGRVHDTLTFSLVGQGAVGARRHYLASHRLNGTNVIAIYGPRAPDYAAVRTQVVDLITAGDVAAVERKPETPR